MPVKQKTTTVFGPLFSLNRAFTAGWRSGIFAPIGMNLALDASARKPPDPWEGLGKDVLDCTVIDLADSPFLECIARVIEPACSLGAERLMVYDSTASATATNNRKHRERTERNSMTRPRQGSELQQNPLSSPSFAFAPKLAKCRPPAFTRPVDPNKL